MSKSIVGGSTNRAGAWIDTVTSYFSVVGGTQESETLAAVEYDYRGLADGESAVFSNLSVYVTTNTQAGACVFSFMLNGVADFTLSIPAGETGWFTSTGSAVVANEDLIALKLVRHSEEIVPGDDTERYFAFDVAHIQLEVSGSDTATWIIGGYPSFYVEANTTVTETRVSGQFAMESEIAATAVDEFLYRHKVRAPGTARYFQCQVTDNDLDGACTITLWKNGSATSLVLTVTAATNGCFIDTTHSVSFATGDQISCQVVTAGSTGTAYIRSMHLAVFSADTLFDVVAAGGTTAAHYDGSGDAYNYARTPIGVLVDFGG